MWVMLLKTLFGQIVMSFETWVSDDPIANGGKRQMGIFYNLFITFPIPMLQANESLQLLSLHPHQNPLNTYAPGKRKNE